MITDDSIQIGSLIILIIQLVLIQICLTINIADKF